MSWAFDIGQIFGIRIRVHYVFLLMLALFGLDGFKAGGAIGGLLAVAFMLIVFGFVVLHELGHSLMARRYGVTVRDITLLPIGGVARMERIPREPKSEILISLAGPAVNVALVMLLSPVLILLTAGSVMLSNTALLHVSLSWVGFTWNLLIVNVAMAVFNAIPAFPLDGGRVFRALLARKRPYVEATATAAKVGRYIAIALAIVGVLTAHLWLAVIAAFIYVAGGQEERLVKYMWGRQTGHDPQWGSYVNASGEPVQRVGPEAGPYVAHPRHPDPAADQFLRLHAELTESMRSSRRHLGED